MIEQGEVDPAESFVRDAAALNAVIGSAYVATHEAVVRAGWRALGTMRRSRSRTRFARGASPRISPW